MNYTSTAIDPDHLVAVVGKARLSRLLRKGTPVTEWKLTRHQIDRLKAGPHGILNWYEHTMYGWLTFMCARCECGEVFMGRLISEVQAMHDEHAGRTYSTKVIHTAAILEG